MKKSVREWKGAGGRSGRHKDFEFDLSKMESHRQF